MALLDGTGQSNSVMESDVDTEFVVELLDVDDDDDACEDECERRDIHWKTYWSCTSSHAENVPFLSVTFEEKKQKN